MWHFRYFARYRYFSRNDKSEGILAISIISIGFCFHYFIFIVDLLVKEGRSYYGAIFCVIVQSYDNSATRNNITILFLCRCQIKQATKQTTQFLLLRRSRRQNHIQTATRLAAAHDSIVFMWALKCHQSSKQCVCCIYRWLIMERQLMERWKMEQRLMRVYIHASCKWHLLHFNLMCHAFELKFVNFRIEY